MKEIIPLLPSAKLVGGFFDTLLGKPAATIIEGTAAPPNAFKLAMEKQKKVMQLKIK